MILDDLLNALADDRFLALRNHGDEWSIEYKLDTDDVPTILRNADLNDLVEQFLDILAEADGDEDDIAVSVEDDS